MNHCLRVREITSNVYHFLPHASALSLALTCRTLLEPGLDDIWRDIQSFEPLIACLPGDLWREERLISEDGFFRSTVLHLRRELTPEDLASYLTRYARRVRSFSLPLVEEPIMLSGEALHALSLVTNNQPGALSPLLKTFEWPQMPMVRAYLGRTYSNSFSPHMLLFLGNHVTEIRISFSFSSADDPPLHLTAVRAAVERLRPRLKTLALFARTTVGKAPLTDKHIIPYAWDSLESLSITTASAALLRRLATLPRLTSLSLSAFERDGEPKPPVPGTFQALVTLKGVSDALSDVEYILRLLPAKNKLETLEWSSHRSTTLADRQGVLKLIGRLCNRSTLRNLTLLEKMIWEGPFEEPIDVDIGQEVDLSPLYAFNNLQTLALSLEAPVNITPEDIPKLTRAWPHLDHLSLCPRFFTSYIPHINHTHVVALTSNLPQLRFLGIRFNATEITGGEPPAGPPAIQLRNLWVGASPICSPSRVAAFIDSQFPHLQHLNIDYNDRPLVAAALSMLDKRWQAVYDAWRALASQTRRIAHVVF